MLDVVMRTKELKYLFQCWLACVSNGLPVCPAGSVALGSLLGCDSTYWSPEAVPSLLCWRFAALSGCSPGCSLTSPLLLVIAAFPAR